MSRVRLSTPLAAGDLRMLRAGDEVLLSGVVYTARDAAHARFAQALQEGGELPIPLAGQVIYYCGPTPAPPGRPVGSAGPTTASRMDRWAPRLYDLGLAATIGKGRRSARVMEALVRNGAVYFVALGGAGALLSRAVKACRPVAYPELGPEAVFEFVVVDMPLVVGCDSHGGDVYGR